MAAIFAGRARRASRWRISVAAALAVAWLMGNRAALAGSPAGAAAPGQGGQAQAVAGPAQEQVNLREAIAIAEQHNLDFRQAQIAVEEARVALEQARAAQLLRPNPVTLLQAEAGLELAQRQLELARAQLHLRVAEDYFGVLRAENLLAVTREGLALAERQLEVAREKFKAGVAAEVEVMRAASQVSDMRANQLQLEGSLKLLMLKFRQTLGLPLDSPTRPREEAVEFEPFRPNLDADLSYALEHRVEILQARTALETARKQVELSDNSYTPKLELSRARLALQKAEATLEQARNGVVLGLRQQFEALSDAEQRLEVLRQRIQEAAETLRVTQSLYDASAATDVELLGAQSGLTKARTDYVNALFDHRLAVLRYTQAVGKSLAEGEAQASP